jgi:transglutaminase-like putative cysteine protease
VSRLQPALARLLATCGALAAALLPHLAHLPAWVSAAVGGAIVWRLAAEQRGWALPPRSLRLGAALAATVGVLAGYRTLNGLDAGTALLAVMAALKLSETRAPRDHAVLVFIGYFMCVAALLYQQSFGRLAYALIVAWLLTAALARVHRPLDANTPVRPFRLAAHTLALGAPLAVVLFLFVPRLEGRFWSVPAHSARHTAGINDEMSPGDVAELSQSEDPAFRVWFDAEVPAPELLYFRVLVLEDFDGRRWRRTGGATDLRVPEVRSTGPVFGYRVALEPTEREWVAALDTVIDWPQGFLKRGRGAQLVYYDRVSGEQRPVTARLSYSLRSAPGAQLMPSGLPRDVLARDRMPPPAGSAPRAQALAAELGAAGGGEREYIRRVLQLFATAPFSYTLSPRPLGARPVDEFLFDTKEGFCEHYASAFTVLMRDAGIPARVVIGYQGGDFNSYGGYLLVRQSHAHAWSEVWLEGAGWTRIDPTAAVAPERVHRGRLTREIAGEDAPGRLWAEFAWLGNLRAAWDATRTAWYERVVGFDPERQARLLESLGLGASGWQGLAVALAVGFALAALALGAWLAWELRPPRTDPVQAAWLGVCARLGAAGLPRAPAEGPVDFGRRVARARPGLAAPLYALVTAYVTIRYLPGATEGERREFVARARRFGEVLRGAAR